MNSHYKEDEILNYMLSVCREKGIFRRDGDNTDEYTERKNNISHERNI